ncbi:MAG: beta-galactosidase trimerization domain-containing protein, partial [Lentisphaeria bacterium]|nr:beta-galactosidase trimerization domain-containing protein [Lentisphaeria bacterium]
AGTPVRGGPHVEHYFMSLNAEETNEIISEVFRVGGKSVALWLVDWFGKTYTDYYGAPERFAEIRHIFKEIGKMRELRFPVADTAVFFSNTTRFAENWWFEKSSDPNAREYESAFTVLGPRTGSWFRFVSDVQITRQNHPLDSYKAIYIPSARYQDEATVKRLKEYADRGGTLIIGSPNMFELSDDGSRRPGLKKELMGLEVSGKLSQSGGLRFENLNIAASGNPAWKMKPVGKAEVIGRFSNGEPAVIANPYGKGKVITFASNPFSFSLLTDRDSWQMFRNLQKQAGCKLDHAVWRFRFPRPGSKPGPRWPKNMVCVTGNAFAWELDSIITGPNKLKPFSASYSLLPDLIPDKQKNCGALFNRRSSLDAPLPRRGSNASLLKNWAAAWKNRGKFSITLDFSEPVGPGEVRLWCHGDIPSIELYSGSGDNSVKEGSAAIPVNAEDVDVREFIIPVGQKSKFFELKFGRRSKGDFYIGEMEFWSLKK